MLDFNQRHVFVGIEFKPSKHGKVHWAKIERMLKSGRVECVAYEVDGVTGGGKTLMDAKRLVEIQEEFGGDCRLCERTVYGNPRYADQVYIRVRFHRDSYVDVYDVSKLPELASPTEEESEGCQSCAEVLEIPQGFRIRLAWDSGVSLSPSFHRRKVN